MPPFLACDTASTYNLQRTSVLGVFLPPWLAWSDLVQLLLQQRIIACLINIITHITHDWWRLTLAFGRTGFADSKQYFLAVASTSNYASSPHRLWTGVVLSTPHLTPCIFYGGGVATTRWNQKLRAQHASNSLERRKRATWQSVIVNWFQLVTLMRFK